jgi:peptidoglycan/xylan/chitin deacetylase (PgdA/CDA1 family)
VNLVAASYRVEWIRKLLLRTPLTLMYHGVPAKAGPGVYAARFEEHVRFLKRHFQLLHADDLCRERPVDSPPAVVLTFDDSFRNNAEVVAPILRKHGVPALFFVCSRHAEMGKYLWFVYLKALRCCFKWTSFKLRGELMDMSPGRRDATVDRLDRWLRELKPYPAAMYRVLEQELPPLAEFVPPEQRRDEFDGMLVEEVEELGADPLFTLGVHTIDHAFLPLCEHQEAVHQITANRDWLQSLSKKPCEYIAYPEGGYSRETLECCREAGLKRGFAVVPKLKVDERWEIPRLGIYSPSVDILGFKAVWGRALAIDRWPRPHNHRVYSAMAGGGAPAAVAASASRLAVAASYPQGPVPVPRDRAASTACVTCASGDSDHPVAPGPSADVGNQDR